MSEATTNSLALDPTESFLLAVALREYLNATRNTDRMLRDHPTSKAVIEKILKRLDPTEGNP